MIDRTPPVIAAFLAREYQAARAAEDQAQIDQSWHHLERAHIAQQALKASNHVASLVGELEAAQRMMAERIAYADSDEEDVRQFFVDDVRPMSAPCSVYALGIFQFVENFSGGIGGLFAKGFALAARHCAALEP